jgi:hypothetical protein
MNINNLRVGQRARRDCRRVWEDLTYSEARLNALDPLSFSGAGVGDQLTLVDRDRANFPLTF